MELLDVCTERGALVCLMLSCVGCQVVSALHYLHTQLKVIHRDVKPSNILINKAGAVKICDFGISGYLIDSIARTKDAGCKPYMAVREAALLQAQQLKRLLGPHNYMLWNFVAAPSVTICRCLSQKRIVLFSL